MALVSFVTVRSSREDMRCVRCCVRVRSAVRAWLDEEREFSSSVTRWVRCSTVRVLVSGLEVGFICIVGSESSEV